MGKPLNKSGLVKKQVQTKRGLRNMWVRAGDAAKRVGGAIKSGAKKAGGFLKRHKGKIAAGALGAAALYLGAKHGGKAIGAIRGAYNGAKNAHALVGKLRGVGADINKKEHLALVAGGAVGGGARGAREGAKADSARATAVRDAVAGVRSGASAAASTVRDRAAGAASGVRNYATGLRDDVKRARAESSAFSGPGRGKEGPSGPSFRQSFAEQRRHRKAK